MTSFRQSDRRELSVPRRVTQPPARVDNGQRRGIEKPAPPAQGSSSATARGIPSRREFRSVEPIRPRYPNDPKGENSLHRSQPERQPRGAIKPPPPRAPSVADDPSRRVLNRILKETSPPPTQPSGESAPGRSVANRPKTSGSPQAPAATSIQTRPPKATRPAPSSKSRGENKPNKDKPS